MLLVEVENDFQLLQGFAECDAIVTVSKTQTKHYRRLVDLCERGQNNGPGSGCRFLAQIECLHHRFLLLQHSFGAGLAQARAPLSKEL